MSHDSSTGNACPYCGDPLPVDGACDCAGDPERDYRTQDLSLQHTVLVWDAEGRPLEVWA